MNTNIKYEKVAEIADGLIAEATKMQDVLNTMKSEFAEVNSGKGTFDGTAASEVRSRFDSFASKFDMFYNAVDSYAKYIRQAAINYQNVDKAAQSGVSNL